MTAHVSDVDKAFEVLLAELADRTAKLVIERLESKVMLRPRLLDYEQAASYLGFLTADGKPSVSALRQRKAENQFSDDCFITIGKAVRWDLEALDKWILAKKQGKATRKARTPSKPGK